MAEDVFEAMDNETDINELTIESIWSASVPWSDRLVQTSSYIGTMASMEVTFVWAADPKDGANQIAKSVEQVDDEIRRIIVRLRATTGALHTMVSNRCRIPGVNDPPK